MFMPARSIPDPPKVRLVDQAREVARLRQYSLRTEEAYWGWIRRFILFHDKRHPEEMGPTEVRAFLSHLVREVDVSVSTQRQASMRSCSFTKACWAGPRVTLLTSIGRTGRNGFRMCYRKSRCSACWMRSAGRRA